MMNEMLFKAIQVQIPELRAIADEIYDNPEMGFNEHCAQNLLCKYLEVHGFKVERGAGGVETAFRAEFKNGQGGPTLGLYCEYDALVIGHACGHHLQGPAAVGAAVAMKDNADENKPFTLVVYGTPAEEGGGGKIPMIESGCFKELDFIIGNHAGAETTTDPQTYCAKSFTVKFHGRSAHAQAHPEDGRSPIEAVLLAMEGLEYMREHTTERTRLHYNPSMTGLAGTSAPEEAQAVFNLRAISNTYTDLLVERFYKIIEGAAMMTGTTYDIEPHPVYAAKFPVPSLIELFYQCASEAGCKRIDPPRTKPGASDFGNIMQVIPGVGIRVEFAPKGTGAHSQEWLALGKDSCAYEYVELAARTLALMCAKVAAEPDYILAKVRKEYPEEKEKCNRS